MRLAAAGTAAAEIARAAGVSLKTAHKWMARFAAEGIAGLADRSSRPHRLHRPTPDGQVEQIIALRRQRLSGDREQRAEIDGSHDEVLDQPSFLGLPLEDQEDPDEGDQLLGGIDPPDDFRDTDEDMLKSRCLRRCRLTGIGEHE